MLDVIICVAVCVWLIWPLALDVWDAIGRDRK